MTKTGKICLAICFAGLVAWGTGNFPCHAQSTTNSGKASGYSAGSLVAPGTNNSFAFNWKHGFQSGNIVQDYGYDGMTGNEIVASNRIFTAGVGEGYGVAANNCGVSCADPCANNCGTVYNTACGWGSGDDCLGLVPLVRDVAQVAFAPVHWMASLLSCGTYANCGCVPVPYRAPCNPCDNRGNWIGCRACGGAGCSGCIGHGSVVRSGALPAGNVVDEGVVSDRVVTPPRSENLPAKAIERTQPARTLQAEPDKSPAGGPTTIVVPVERESQQAKGRPQNPNYVFVTPDGKVIPQEQVRGFGNGKPGTIQYKVAKQNDIRQMSYESRPVSTPVQSVRPSTPTSSATQAQGWQTYNGQNRPQLGPVQRKYSTGKF